MPLYVSDYDAATNWCDLETDGLYMRTLRLLWSTPTQSIPDDKAWIIRKLRITNTQYNIFLIIKDEFLASENNRIFQKRLLEEFTKAESLHDARSKAGKRGGLAKSLKSNKNDPSKALANGKQGSSKALASTLTLTSTVISKKETPIVPLKRGKRKCSYPNNFIPNEEQARKYWKTKDRQDLDYDDEAFAFKAYCLANNKTYSDWNAAWVTRYANAVKFNKAPIKNAKVNLFSEVKADG
jgi:uncharacterized protein YdaU (DUF1376 family)